MSLHSRSVTAVEGFFPVITPMSSHSNSTFGCVSCISASWEVKGQIDIHEGLCCYCTFSTFCVFVLCTTCAMTYIDNGNACYLSFLVASFLVNEGKCSSGPQGGDTVLQVSEVIKQI